MTSEAAGLVVVSGAGGALGGRIAAHFAGQDRPVLGLDRRFDDGKGECHNLTRMTLDLASETDVRQALAEAQSESGPIVLLVNAVGMIWSEPLVAFHKGWLAPHSAENWRAVVDSNLTAAFIVAKEVAAVMLRSGGGAIVNFSSIAASGNPGQAAYAAAKAGVESLTKVMARELGPMGVRSNAVALGFIDAPTTRASVPADQLRAYEERTPVKRLGLCEEVIDAVSFLVGNQFVNGAILQVDGGLQL